jgi:signal transduction histidine kinase
VQYRGAARPFDRARGRLSIEQLPENETSVNGRDKGDDSSHAGRAAARAQLRLVELVEASSAGAAAVSDTGDLNLLILQPVFRYVKQNLGQAALDRLAIEGGLQPEMLERSGAWITHEQFERILAIARALVASDEDFVRMCAHEMVKVYGPMLLVLRCMSIRAAYNMLARTVHLASRISHYEVVGGTRTSVTLRYTSTRRESRLMCLSRHAQLRVGPTVYWGMAPARLEETSCIAHGDEYCEYGLRWYQPIRWRGPLSGALLGAVTAAVLLTLETGLALQLALGSLPLLGMLVGLILEQRRLVADHMVFAEETNRELEHLVQAHARAVDEVLALHQRERTWNQQLENQIALRTARLDAVVERFRDGGQPRRDKLRSLSHDINNPLTVLLGLANQLRRTTPTEADTTELVDTLEGSVQQMSLLVRELTAIVREDTTVPELVPEVVDVEELTARIRRQLRATVVGRDIRVTVFQTREVPSAIRAIRMMLERVVDNLLTNAAKYTERGSIVVEVGGTPGFLLLKISDTGRGIGPERLEQVLRACGPDPNPPVGGSHGAGLSIVARLLDQLGGRLEIMSAPGEGTTVWMYVPCDAEPQPRATDPDQTPETIEHVLRRVVKIRPKTHASDNHDGGGR